MMHCGVVILGAGASTRMGRPKLLLPWGNTSILGHLLRQWSKLGAAQIAVVHAATDLVLLGELNALRVPPANRVPNHAPERGMFSSIQSAATWNGWMSHLTHFVTVLGDQPHLKLETLDGLLQFAGSHLEQVCQPSRESHPRHPVILPRQIWAQLPNTPARTLKDFLLAHSAQRALYNSFDPALDYDLDTPADYDLALKLFTPQDFS